MVSWADLYKTWQNQGKFDPIKRKYVTDDEIEGAGVSIPDAITDIRAAGQFGGGSNSLRLRDTNEFVDLTSIANRQARYKEYERLRIVPEIETAITIFADEACVAGNTLVATPFGMQSIEELTKRFPDGEKFLVYCYDFKKQDISLGLAHHPRLVKKAKTIIIITEDGERLSCTTDHKILLRNEQWVEAGNLKEGDELMPFYRKSPYKKYPGVRGRIFPRIYTLKKGWLTERDFINEWRGEPHKQDFYKIVRAVCSGLKPDQVSKVIDKDVRTYCAILNQNGFSARELKLEFRNKKDRRVVFKIIENKEEDVYDLSVDEHENFCTNFGVVHNCQIGDNGNLFDVKVENQEIKKELEKRLSEFGFFSPYVAVSCIKTNGLNSLKKYLEKWKPKAEKLHD